MKSQHVVFVNLVLIAIGIGIALVLAEITLRAIPGLVPEKVRVNPPVRRVKANLDDTYDIRYSDGDLFYWMSGTFPPLSPEEDKVISRVHMVTDANGFRNFPPEEPTHAIVALGDSFTRASLVPTPWPQKLAELTGYSVINLADAGIGPLEEFDILQRYGIRKRPKWIILAYFEGNDLYDAAAYDQSNPFIIVRFGNYIYTQSKESWRKRSDKKGIESINSEYRYPIKLTLNNSHQDMVFFSPYISWLSVDSQAIESSQNYRLVREAILGVMELSAASNTRFLLIYIPSKEHTYLPLVKDPDTMDKIFMDVNEIIADQAGYLQFTNQRATPERTLTHMADQALVLAKLARENQIEFLDLTPFFRASTESGQQLYFTYDTHPNQAGQDLVAEEIAGYISSQELMAGK